MIELDKQAHVWAGATISFAMVIAGLSPLIGFLVASFAGLMKEVYDKGKPNHTSDKLDLMATIVGGLVASIYSWLWYL